MERTGYGVTADEATSALERLGPGEHLASSLRINGSIQSISNALRWAESYGWITRTHRGSRGSLWRMIAKKS